MWPIKARPGFVLKFPIQSLIYCVALEALYYWCRSLTRRLAARSSLPNNLRLGCNCDCVSKYHNWFIGGWSACNPKFLLRRPSLFFSIDFCIFGQTSLGQWLDLFPVDALRPELFFFSFCLSCSIHASPSTLTLFARSNFLDWDYSD